MRNQFGYSLLEVLAVLGIVAILSGIAVASLKELYDPLEAGTAEAAHFLRQVRSRSIATTSAYEVRRVAQDQLTSGYAATCGAASFVPEPQLSLVLPAGVNISNSSWRACFTSRGLAESNATLLLADNESRTRAIEVYLGGAVREH